MKPVMKIAALAASGAALAAHALVLPPPGADAPARQPSTPTSASNPASFTNLSKDAPIAIGYAGLDESVRERDMARVRAALAAIDAWPTRDVFTPISVNAYPEFVITGPPTSEAVPLYVIVDPAEIHKARHARQGPAGQPLIGPEASVSVGMIAATRFDPEQRFMRVPWPAWADSKFRTPDGFEGPAPMANHRWSLFATSYVGMTNVVGPSLLRLGVPLRSTFRIERVSSSCWRVVTIAAGRDASETLVFPLWDGTGVMRDPAVDPFADDRNGPTSTYVRSRGLEWAIEGRSLLVLPEPKPMVPVGAATLPNRERVIVPETLAQTPTPIACFYELAGSTPLATDFELCVGQPEPGRVPYAVCVFSTCSDLQLRELAARLGQIGQSQHTSDPGRPASK